MAAPPPSGSDADRDPIEVMAESFLERFRRGEHPSIDEYAAKYPELAGEIRELLPALVQLERELLLSGDATGSFHAGPRVAALRGAPRQLGDYTILREVGRGGMGVVYEAMQQSLGRHVALKVLPWQAVGSSSQLERFRLEARSAARLHHTNIVPVFGVGEAEGVHYYAMQFIHGQGLDAVIDELRRLRDGEGDGPPGDSAEAATMAATVALGLLGSRLRRPDRPGDSATVAVAADATDATDPSAGGGASGSAERASALMSRSELTGAHDRRYFRRVARLALQVAEGLAHAHGQGVLHRDVKPSNLLVDTRGTVWITDFGLAKVEGADGPTRTGDVVGTLRYMAPERLEGRSDHRGDLYAIGATLYELLTLRPLFGAVNRAKLVDRILHEPPAAPRRLDRHVPKDLETIALKALAKEPAHRYRDAEAMAADLLRFLDDRPILARRAGATEQFWRWCRRNPAVASLVTLVLALMVGGTIAAALAAHHFRLLARSEKQARDDARGALVLADRRADQAEAARLDAVDQTYVAIRNEIQGIRLAHDSGWRREALERLDVLVGLGSRKLDRFDLRSEALACLGRLDVRRDEAPGPFRGGAYHLRFSPDGRTLAANAIEEGRVNLFELDGGRELPPVPKSVGYAPFAFHPGGALAVPSAPGRVSFHRLSPGQPVFPEINGPGHALSLSFSRSGHRLAIAWGDVDLRDFGRPAGCRLITVHETATGAPLRTIAVTPKLMGVYRVPLALSPDGDFVATIGPLRVARLHPVDGDDGPVNLGAVDARICALAFHPDGHALVAAGIAIAKLWDLRDRTEVLSFHAPPGGFGDVAFSPDGQLLAAACNDRTARLWDAGTGRELVVAPTRPGSACSSIAFSPRDDRFAVGGGCVSVFEVEGRRERRVEGSHTYAVFGLCFDPARPVLYTGRGGGRVSAWELRAPFATPLRSTAFGIVPNLLLMAPGGEHLVAGLIRHTYAPPDADLSIRVWPLDGTAAERRLEGPLRAVDTMTFDASGRRLAAGSRGGGLFLWEFESGKPSRGRQFGEAVKVAQFLDDERLLVAVGDRLLSLAAEDGRTLLERILPGSVEAFVVTPDRTLALVGTSAGTIHRVRLSDLALGGSRTISSGGELALALNPDGRLLASTIEAGDGVLLLDARTLEPIALLLDSMNLIKRLAFDPGGDHLALGGNDVVLWDFAIVRAELARLGLDLIPSGP